MSESDEGVTGPIEWRVGWHSSTVGHVHTDEMYVVTMPLHY